MMNLRKVFNENYKYIFGVKVMELSRGDEREVFQGYETSLLVILGFTRKEILIGLQC